MLDGKKIMFEIFRERQDGPYRVVYFTELGEHEKEDALSDAMNGKHIFSGYFLHREREHAKSVVTQLLSRLNEGEALSEEEVESALGGVCV